MAAKGFEKTKHGGQGATETALTKDAIKASEFPRAGRTSPACSAYSPTVRSYRSNRCREGCRRTTFGPIDRATISGCTNIISITWEG